MSGFAPSCGSTLHEDAQFSASCGRKVEELPTSTAAAAPLPPAAPTQPAPSGGEGPKGTGLPDNALIRAGATGVALIIAAVLMFGCSDGDEAAASSSTTRAVSATTEATTATTAAGGESVPGKEEVFFEPINEPIPNGFSDDGFLTNLEEPIDPDTGTGQTGVALPASTGGGGTVEGTEPGLYGGTRDSSRCDPDALVGFLEADSNKALAWASVHDIGADEIADFVAELTPVVLTRDTAVTNHGYADGQATPLQSILQAGTAVLVDDRGIPRAKCSCGNPLREPEPGLDPTEATGTPWGGFDPDRVVIVRPGQTSDEFVVVDVDGGFPFGRTAGKTPRDSDLAIDTRCDLFPDDPSCPDGEMVLLYDLGNSSGIAPDTAPAAPSLISFETPVRITRLRTYHWNESQGSPAGSISMVGPSGDTYGPWQAEGCGQSVAFDDPCAAEGNLYWLVDIQLHLPPGTFQVIDSDPATWANNPDSGHAGHVLVWGYVLDEPPPFDP